MTPNNTDTALLVPAYNCADALRDTVSALPRELPLFILIIDDGSSPSIDKVECDPVHRIEVIHNSSNLGIERSLRSGMTTLSARGFTYVARLDAGDFALPGRFQKQRAFLENNSKVSLVGSACEIVDDQGRQLYIWRPPLHNDEIKRSMLLRSCFAHPAVMMRVEAAVQAGSYRGDYPCAEDLDLFLRIAARDEVANLPDVLTRYEVSPHSLSSQRRHRQLKSLLRLQMTHGRWHAPQDWLGVAKTMAHFTLSRAFVERIKSRLWL